MRLKKVDVVSFPVQKSWGPDTDGLARHSSRFPLKYSMALSTKRA